MRYDLFISADQNDADYITEISVINENELIIIKPVIDAIKNFEPYKVFVNNKEYTHNHNFPFGEDLPQGYLGEKNPEEIYNIDKDLIEFFEEFVPFNTHTIEKIEICPHVEKERLL